MSLERRCQEAFSEGVQERGRRYAGQGKICIDSLSDFEVRAHAHGTEIYEMRLLVDHDEAEIGVECDCRYARMDFCKHLWGLLLVLDRELPGRFELAGTDDINLFFLEDPALITDDPGSFTRAEPWGAVSHASALTLAQPRAPASPPPAPWQARLAQVRQAAGLEFRSPRRGELEYRLDVDASRMYGKLLVGFVERQPRADGSLGRERGVPLSRADAATLVRPEDKRALSLLFDLTRKAFEFAHDTSGVRVASFVEPAAFARVLPALCETGRFAVDADEIVPLRWAGDEPYRLLVELGPADRAKRVRATAYLVRGDEPRVPLVQPLLVHGGGAVIFADQVALLERRHGPLAVDLRRRGGLEAPRSEAVALVRGLAEIVGACGLEIEPALASTLGLKVEGGQPQARVRFDAPDGRRRRVPARIDFGYGDARVELHDPSGTLVGAGGAAIVCRDAEAEAGAVARIRAAGVGLATPKAPAGVAGEVPHDQFAAVVRRLLDQGIAVEARGRAVRRGTTASLKVRTGIDWFEVWADASFDGASVELPAILRAIRDGQGFVQLGDGTSGLIPDEWLERFGNLAKLAPTGEGAGEGAGEPGAVRFSRAQALLLDALLASEQDAEVDAAYAQLRRRIRAHDRVRPQPAPRGFRGELRAYQQAGVGWLRFLEELGLGGCLADDMGLGKTVQILAHLVGRRQRRRRAGEPDRASLVVVPRSLVFNWESEAARFAPGLKVAVHHGAARGREASSLEAADLIVTTYATLRRDIQLFRELEFDYAILDEAQAIKNPKSQMAKACRLLRARHRLALTGTPIENRLSDLFSIFDFLNPGLLGRSSVFDPDNMKDAGDEFFELLARALRPVLLRRTKEQVLDDLPPKVEQTVACELSGAQQRLYRELRDHYRASLKAKLGADGSSLKRATIHVLEALLRLRQAACHPGLLDDGKRGASSAKLDALLERLVDVVQSGHKALVFSQFTSFLDIVRRRLGEDGIDYLYLDGSTRDRGSLVERFQRDDDVKVFLLSLKAAGHGLNLTAAEYVFLLDPWWNPAVEAQAVDRAHRIGQRRRVFAYRLIAKDTVEEKVLALQTHKRQLADAVVQHDASLLADLSTADLELLLS
jgi:superfamily II DNA or RNA helicase